MAEEQINDEVAPDLRALSNSPSNTSTGVRQLGIPKPIPRGGSTTALPQEAPLSEDTISINRPIIDNDARIVIPKEEKADVKSTPIDKRLKIFCYNCGQKLDLTDMTPFSQIDCPSCASTIIVPKWFDNYLLEELCGTGGMAVVYRGLDLALDREVAIKILNNESANDESRNKLFLHEARTVATLNHFAILPIYTCGEYEGQAYFVMQYMSGGSLDVEIANAKGKGLPTDDACKWLKDIAEGLDNAKRHGVIHHDIKPGNFMLDGDRNIKIGDFGISQAMHDKSSEELAKLAGSWGSPQYVSPEKIETGVESHLGDIYSLGATFYHILTGVTPYDNDDPKELLKAKLAKDPLDISKHNEELPTHLCELIMSMMNRTPEARPSYRDIVAELNSINKKPSRTGAKTAKRSITLGEKKKRTQSIQLKNSPKKRISRLPKKKQSIVSYVFHFLIALALVGGGYYLWANGYLANYIEGAPQPRPASYDYLPDATSALAKGKIRRAMIQSRDTLDSSDETLAVKKQAAIQLALATYLSGTSNAKTKCAEIADKLKTDGMEIDAPELAILSYLSKPTHTSSRMRRYLKNQGPITLAGEIAVFLRNTKEPKTPETIAEVRDAYKRYNVAIDNFPKDAWERCFKDRIKMWYDWLFMRKGNSSSLEKLIGAANLSSGKPEQTAPAQAVFVTSGSLSGLTSNSLRATRPFASKRPRPKNFDFSERALKNYLSTLPAKTRRQEEKRASNVTPLKRHLCAMMFHMPYEGAGVKLRNGRLLKGKVMANPKYLSIRLNSGGRKRVNWNELAPSQFAEMLAYYAKTRIAMDKRKDGAEDYIRAALFSDWYGNYDDAVKYAKLAVAADAAVKTKVTNLLTR